jgi:hypothetical protein
MVLSVQRFELVRLITYITVAFFSNGVDCRRYHFLLHVRWQLTLKLLEWCGRVNDPKSCRGL